MNDEMKRKVVTFVALALVLAPYGEVTGLTEDELSAVMCVMDEAATLVNKDEQIALIKTMLREHLADILAREEDVE